MILLFHLKELNDAAIPNKPIEHKIFLKIKLSECRIMSYLVFRSLFMSGMLRVGFIIHMRDIRCYRTTIDTLYT